MNDMSQVIIPKSDQLNADTLLAGPMTATIKGVHIHGGQEQPVSIELEETPLFYRPCKSMSRVLVQAWGPDANRYVGRSLTLYRDPSVKWGGMEVGGIRISHMSDIDGKKVMQLTATKGQRKPHVVLPLVLDQKRPATQNGPDKAAEWVTDHLALMAGAVTVEDLETLITNCAKTWAKLSKDRPDLHQRCVDAANARRIELTSPASEATADTGYGSDDDAYDAETGEVLPAGDVFDELEANAKPLWELKAQEIRNGIAGAKTKALLDAAERAYVAHCVTFSQEVANELEAALAAKKKALAG